MNILRILLGTFCIINGNLLLSQTLTLVKDINSFGSSNPYDLQVFNNKMYFVANPNSGYKIFSSDGTASGTQLVGPTVGSGNLYPLMAYNNTLFFNYDDGINGAELWKSDGTTAGTVMVKDIISGNSGSNPQYLSGANGRVFFITGTQLWSTDGTSAGTIQLTPNSMVAERFNNQLSLPCFDNHIYFSGNNGNLGLWKSDGTVSGTQLLKNISVNAYLKNVAIYNGEMYFAASDGTNGYELWKTNGTTAGTLLVKNINTASDSNPTKFLVSNNRIFFLADDGMNGEELWSSDGTSAGTQIVKDVTAGSSSSNIQTLIEYNNNVYFFALSGSNRLLYKTDGTAAGTVPVKTIPYNIVHYAYVFNGKLYFLAKSFGSSYLFESDGTSAGTFQISPNINSENYSDLQFTTYNSELYLPCYNGNTGVELNKLSLGNLAVSDGFPSQKFEIYPNPTSDFVWINNNDKVSNYKILDMSGKILDFGKLNMGSSRISMEKYNTGVYILQLIDGDKQSNFKILKR